MKLLGLLIAAVAARGLYLSRGKRIEDALVYVDATRKLALEQRGFAVDRYLAWHGGAPEVQA